MQQVCKLRYCTHVLYLAQPRLPVQPVAMRSCYHCRLEMTGSSGWAAISDHTKLKLKLGRGGELRLGVCSGAFPTSYSQLVTTSRSTVGDLLTF